MLAPFDLVGLLASDSTLGEDTMWLGTPLLDLVIIFKLLWESSGTGLELDAEISYGDFLGW